MTIPLWIWPALAVVCLFVLAEVECWQINRRRDNARAIEAERVARQLTAPLGNVDRVYNRTKDAA